MALGLGSGHYINYGVGRYKTAGEGVQMFPPFQRGRGGGPNKFDM